MSISSVRCVIPLLITYIASFKLHQPLIMPSGVIADLSGKIEALFCGFLWLVFRFIYWAKTHSLHTAMLATCPHPASHSLPAPRPVWLLVVRVDFLSSLFSFLIPPSNLLTYFGRTMLFLLRLAYKHLFRKAMAYSPRGNCLSFLHVLDTDCCFIFLLTTICSEAKV